MSANSFGRLFKVTTFGESHGKAIGGIVAGCPPKLPLTEDDFLIDLARRRPGNSSMVSQRQEPDQVQLLSGISNGLTNGAPIGILIENVDIKAKDYKNCEYAFRPGHADWTYHKKYHGVTASSGGGRSSARETAVRVAAGVIAKKYLAINFATKFTAKLNQVGSFKCDSNLGLEDLQLKEYLHKVRKERDSVGAKLDITIANVPVGLGEPVFDKITALLAHAWMSIPAVRAVGFGDAEQCVVKKGSEYRDPITSQGFASNIAGGTLGGITTGEEITASICFKPTSSIPQPIKTIDKYNKELDLTVTGRHDPCVGIRALPIVEAMAALVLTDCVLRHRGQNGDLY